MNGYRREQADPRSLVVNQGLTESTVDELYYDWWLYPGDYILGAGGVTFAVTAARWSSLDFPNGADSFAYAQVARRTSWPGGKFHLKIFYSSPVGSTNAFGLRATVWGVRAGEVLTPATVLGVVSPAMPGPAVADTLLSVEGYTTTASSGSDDELFAVRLDRPDAATPDANANALRVLAVRLRLIPSTGH